MPSLLDVMLADGASAVYKMAETGGTTLVDSSGNARDGTRSNTITPSPGFVTSVLGEGSSLFNNRGSDVCSVPLAAWMQTNHVTAEAFIYLTSAAGGVVMAREDWGQGFGPGYVWLLSIDQGRLSINAFSGNSALRVEIMSASGVIMANTLHHVALTFDGATLRGYVDGVQVCSGALAGNLSSGNTGIWIGRTAYSGSGFLSGRVQYAAVYPTALPAASIANHYSSGLETPGPPDTPVVGLSGKALNASALLKWTANSQATGGYDIRVNGGTITSVPLGTVKTIIGSLANDVPSTFEIRATNDKGIGPWSAPISVTPSSRLLFYDDFDRAPSNTTPGVPVYGTGYTPDNYVAAGSVWGITANGQLYDVTNAERNLLAQGADAYDIDIEMTIAAASSGALSNMNMVLRRNTAATTGFINVSNVNGVLAIYYRDSVDFRPLAMSQGITWANGDRMRVVAQGKTIYAFRNEKLLASARDDFSLPAHTGWGVRLTRADQYVDELYARSPVAGMMNKNGRLTQFNPAASNLGLVHVYKGRDTKTADAGSVA